VIESNIQSAAAALRHPPKPGFVSRDFLHASDYLVYAYLQLGDDDHAKEALSKIDPTAQYERSNGPASYALAATAARFAIERGAWREAAALVPRAVPYDWEHYPWSEAVTYAARGLGSARSGDAAGAQAALTELERLEPLVQSAWWKGRVHIDHDVVLGWTDYVRGDKAHAEQVMRAAAEREAQTGKDSVEPGHVISAIEQFGDLLLELKRPGEALAEFKTALDESPHRLAALYGAGLSAEQSGNTAEAKRYYSELTSIAGGSKRPELAHAHEYLAAHP